MHLCPIDLKKLYLLNDFDILKESNAIQFYKKYEMKQQMKWIKQILSLFREKKKHF